MPWRRADRGRRCWWGCWCHTHRWLLGCYCHTRVKLWQVAVLGFPTITPPLHLQRALRTSLFLQEQGEKSRWKAPTNLLSLVCLQWRCLRSSPVPWGTRWCWYVKFCRPVSMQHKPSPCLAKPILSPGDSNLLHYRFTLCKSHSKDGIIRQ